MRSVFVGLMLIVAVGLMAGCGRSASAADALRPQPAINPTAMINIKPTNTLRIFNPLTES